MKITVTFKTPDAVRDAVLRAVLRELPYDPEISEADMDYNRESMTENISAILGRWVQYGECIEIEFDTVAKTAKVLGG